MKTGEDHDSHVVACFANGAFFSRSPHRRSPTPSEPATQAAEAAQKVRYRTATVGGVQVFYREAGRADSPAILLLHGFPTSSHMYRNLIPALADRYGIIAPDYPGFGYSAIPTAPTSRTRSTASPH